MKSLFKISFRYVLTAAFITVFVLCVNVAAVIASLYQTVSRFDRIEIRRNRMERIEQEMSVTEEGYRLSEDGYALLRESSYLWAMRLNGRGEVVWEYQLPEEIPRRYNLGDVAVFSRWYLKDYPVFVWRSGEELMVYGMPKELARFAAYGDVRVYGRLPELFCGLVALNLLLIAGLALFFGFRFYRSLRPIAGGIERLSQKEPVELPERGMAGDLARQLNQASAILRAQDEQLERRDQARTDWIAGVSHDVRTPLSLIMGLSDELACGQGENAAFREKAGTIRAQSRIIENLIADLNLTMKLEYHSQPLRKERVCPAGLLRECIAEVYNQGIGEEYQILPVISREAERIILNADRQLLLRAFRNLIGNGIRHNPGGCCIRAEAWGETGEICLLFADSGPGIPARVAEILEKDQPEWPEVHIMGLRIVKQIVSAHGGRMSFAERESGGGSDILLRLPVVKSG